MGIVVFLISHVAQLHCKQYAFDHISSMSQESYIGSEHDLKHVGTTFGCSSVCCVRIHYFEMKKCRLHKDITN